MPDTADDDILINASNAFHTCAASTESALLHSVIHINADAAKVCHG